MATAAISLFVALVFIAILAVGWLLADLVSGDQKRASEAVKAALPILAAAIGLPLLIWRLRILDRQTRISEDKTRIDRETHYTSIFSRSIDQLGQTREVKSLSDSDENTESITRTVPNIEVRLGGIHSLVRLAEESARDRSKIENILLSYVRENSWSDRDGIRVVPVERPRNPAWEWNYPYSIGKITAEAQIALTSWEKANAEQLKQQKYWGAALKETRVDVSEAIEAIPKLRSESLDKEEPRFYECLFVGTRFEATILNLCRFDRCTFVRCFFNSAAKYNFSSSKFVDCVVGTVDSGHLIFSRCTIDGLTVRRLTNTSCNMTTCEISGASIDDMKGGILNFSRSTLHKIWVSAEREIDLNLTNAAFAGGTLRGFKASALSDFKGCVFVNTRLAGLDLSEVHQISDNVLVTARGDPATRNPNSLARPFGWDNFDPNYKDDDIPF
jgi:uncharacterized protein YjbI with pentapeptide repeats